MNNREIKKPPLDGAEAAKLLYSDEQNAESNIRPSDDKNNNILQPPSLLPDDPRGAYLKGYKEAKRIWRNDEQYLLNLFRERVAQIREDFVRSGEVEPVDEQERQWAKEGKRWKG